MSTSHAPVIVIAKERHFGSTFDFVLPDDYPVIHEEDAHCALRRLHEENTDPVAIILALCLCERRECKEEARNNVRAFRDKYKDVPILFITYGTGGMESTMNELMEAGVTHLIEDGLVLCDFLQAT